MDSMALFSTLKINAATRLMRIVAELKMVIYPSGMADE